MVPVRAMDDTWSALASLVKGTHNTKGLDFAFFQLE